MNMVFDFLAEVADFLFFRGFAEIPEFWATFAKGMAGLFVKAGEKIGTGEPVVIVLQVIWCLFLCLVIAFFVVHAPFLVIGVVSPFAGAVLYFAAWIYALSWMDKKVVEKEQREARRKEEVANMRRIQENRERLIQQKASLMFDLRSTK